MTEFDASLPGSSFEQNDKRVQKRPDDWVQKPPPKNPGKPNPDSKRGHKGRGNNK